MFLYTGVDGYTTVAGGVYGRSCCDGRGYTGEVGSGYGLSVGELIVQQVMAEKDTIEDVDMDMTMESTEVMDTEKWDMIGEHMIEMGMMIQENITELVVVLVEDMIKALVVMMDNDIIEEDMIHEDML